MIVPSMRRKLDMSSMYYRCGQYQVCIVVVFVTVVASQQQCYYYSCRQKSKMLLIYWNT